MTTQTVSNKVKQQVEAKYDLKSYVPKGTNDSYIKRPVEEQVATVLKNTTKPVFLLGDAGVGKTAMAKNVAASMGLPFLLIQVDASLNFNELLYRVRFENATAHYEPGLLLRFIQQPSVVLFDELPSASAEIFFKLHELLQERRIYVKELDAVFEVHPECKIMAAGNFKSSIYVGNNKLNAALVSRFIVKILEDFTVEEISKTFDIPDANLKKHLVDFYMTVKSVVKQQNKRFIFTIRHLQSIAQLLNCGFNVHEAMAFGFLDSIAVNNGLEEKSAIYDLAVTKIPQFLNKEFTVVNKQDKA
jgi:MoxR-like ATPase